MEYKNIDVKNVLVILFANTEEKKDIVMKVIVMEICYVNMGEKKDDVMKMIAMEMIYVNMEGQKMYVMRINVMEVVFVNMVKIKFTRVTRAFVICKLNKTSRLHRIVQTHKILRQNI